MPSKTVLEKYDLTQFVEVVAAVKQGNILQLNKAIHQHEMFFIKCGIYLLLEKLKIITFRNLFKKVWVSLCQSVCHLLISHLAFAFTLKMESCDPLKHQWAVLGYKTCSCRQDISSNPYWIFVLWTALFNWQGPDSHGISAFIIHTPLGTGRKEHFPPVNFFPIGPTHF